MNSIIDAVSKVFGVTIEDLKSRKRDEETVLVRQVAMYLMWQLTDCSLSQIGQELGGRTPATISHGYQKIASRIQHDIWLQDRINDIELILGNKEEIMDELLLKPEENPYRGMEGCAYYGEAVKAFDEGAKAQLAKVLPKLEVIGETLMKLLVGVGVVSKDATPTYPELIMAAEEYIKHRLECPKCLGTGQSGVKEMGSHTTCSACNGTGKHKPREKIVELQSLEYNVIFATLNGRITEEEFEVWLDFIADQILALIPDEEEIKKQLHLADKNYLDLKNTFDERLEEAKREERERIVKELEDAHRPDYKMRQVISYLKHRFGIPQ